METTQELRKGLILYLNLFSYYLLMLILWKNMAQSNGQGTHHRRVKNRNNTRTSQRFDFISNFILLLFIDVYIMERHGSIKWTRKASSNEKEWKQHKNIVKV